MGLLILILSLGRQKHKDGQALHSDSQASLGCSTVDGEEEQWRFIRGFL